MFYKNLKKHKKTTEKNLTFSIFEDGIKSKSDDSVSKPNECKLFYNISYNDGALKTGLGFQDLKVPASLDALDDLHTYDFSMLIDDIKSIYTERWYNTTYKTYIYQLLLLDGSYNLWSCSLIDQYDGAILQRTTRLNDLPTYQCVYRLDQTDVNLFFSNEGLIIIGQYYDAIFEEVPALISCVVHYDNLFGVTNDLQSTLIYTDNLDVTTLRKEDSSTIEFLDNRGSFKRLVSFNDYVYLFREYGITKLSIYSSKSNFSFTHLYTSSSKIFENSISVCGDKIFFMTREGLYSFNGNSVQRICEQYDSFWKNLDNSNCSSACLNGKYYLATRCDFEDLEEVGCEVNETYSNNVLFEIDVETFELNVLRGVDIRKILAVDTPFLSKLCACFNDYTQRVGELTFNGKIFEASLNKKWSSFSTDLGYQSKKKKIKEIVLTSLYDCVVTIESDEETKSFSFVGRDKEQRLSVCLYGKRFKFSFSSDCENCEICKPLVVFDVVS
ncbi:MAG: hypothetical protein E7375_03655 [Clostridiales bacterium]|nr:hypothetical protein [Clostridiales bacterium]